MQVELPYKMRMDQCPGSYSPGPLVEVPTPRSATWFPSKEYQGGDLEGADRGCFEIVECDLNNHANADLSFIPKSLPSSFFVYTRQNRYFPTCRN